VNVRRLSPRNKTDLADTLALQLRALGLPPPVRELQAIPGRRFRCDLAYPDQHIAIEVDGGDQTFGRHGRATGMASDCEKQNLLTLHGWKCYRFSGSMVKNGAAVHWLESVLLER
jgi:very-short-patch-repair endonuclease